MAHMFVELPIEILECVLLHLDPPSLITVAQTCRALNQIASNASIVWRNLCRTQFKFWAPHHRIAAKFAGPLSDVDWRALYHQRLRTNRETARLLQCLLTSQRNRIQHMNQIADIGLDAKQTLLGEYACPDDAEDVLARRWYAKSAIDMIQRESAIGVWTRLDDGEDIPIEHALGAYDVFTSISANVDLDTIDQDISRLAQDLLKQHPDFHAVNLRHQAFTIAEFLRKQGFRGVSEDSYGALRNNFIGYALRSPLHESLPLISVAIFCALSNRLGLDARPCGFVFHVYCIVYAPKDYTLDGDYKPTSNTEMLDSMYLDPFRSSAEVPVEELQHVLREMGVPNSEYQTFLGHASTRAMVLRTSRNIMNSVQTTRQNHVGGHDILSFWVHSFPDIDSSFYATIWSMLILSPDTNTQGPTNTILQKAPRRRQYLPYLLDYLHLHHPWDVSLIERHVIPFFSDEREGLHLENFARKLRNDDALPKAVKSRGNGAAENVQYKIGQLFNHRRYQYEGVIIGWDTSCSQEEEWIQEMSVDRLDGGRTQPFYHVLVCDKSIRYVAEENIVPVANGIDPTVSLLRLAGRHFKRWDSGTGRFVSNLLDEYPDD